jgi:glutaminyl-tRNA synthetase
VYPLYDYAHPIEDAIEGITHSLCTLEFENNRALYDWVVERWQDFERSRGRVPSLPRQYEFARGNLEYTVVSKRKLLELVKGGHVSGWDDPRMPTLAGLRRRGVTPEAIRSFWERMGIARTESRIEIASLEFAIRDDLNQRVPRVLCVLRPLRVVITNYPEGQTEELDAPYYPHDVPSEGSRKLRFSRFLYIDREDFMEEPPRGYFRLAPGREVRLRYGYMITCSEVVRDESGEIVEIRCTYDPETRGGNAPDGRTVRGTIHWVSAEHSLPCEVRLYDRLFAVPNPDEGDQDFKTYLNPESLVVLEGARIEPSVGGDAAGSRYQFERQGYFCSDAVDSSPEALVFNRTVTLRDTWAKVAQAGRSQESTGQPKPKAKGRTGARDAMPELAEEAARFQNEFDLAPHEAVVLGRSEGIAGLFEATIHLGSRPKAVAGWIINDLLPELKANGINEIAFAPQDLHALIGIVDEGTISRGAGKTVLAEMVQAGGDPREIAERRGLRQVSDPGVLLGFFVGQAMARTGGKANPEVVKGLVERRLQDG